jgi:hypothetical protein
MNWPEIFIVGSFWFWVLLLAESIVLIILLEWGRGTIATLTFLATLFALQFLGDVKILGYVVEHPWTIALGAIGYFAVGTCWSVVKWWFYVREQRTLYDELRSAFLRVHGFERQSAMPEELQSTWRECLAAAESRRKLDVRPLVARHKAHVVRWMSYWPWSLFWTVLKDPVRKAFLSTYYHLAEYLQEVSDRAFKGLDADLPKESEASLPPRIDPVLAEFGVADIAMRKQAKRTEGSVRKGN